MPPLKLTKTPSPVITEPSMPSDPAIRAIVDDVLAQARLALMSSAAAPKSSAPSDLDKVVKEYLATRNPVTRQRLEERSRAFLNAPANVRSTQLGRYATISSQDYQALGFEGVASRAGAVPVDVDMLKKGLSALHARLSSAHTTVSGKVPMVEHEAKDSAGKKIKLDLDPDLIAGAAFKKMRLFIRSVTCVEETDELGSDEINLGGTVTDPFGNSSIINQFEVSDDFDEDETVEFGMSKVFCTWSLETKSQGFPYVYGALVSMGEKDDGGFYQFLKGLWKHLDTAVKAAIGAAVGAAVGAALGSVIPGIGTLAGLLGGLLVGVLVDWIISWFDNPDDIVGVKALIMSLGSARRSYYDWAKLTSGTGWPVTLQFKGDGGRYVVKCGYRVFTQ